MQRTIVDRVLLQLHNPWHQGSNGRPSNSRVEGTLGRRRRWYSLDPQREAAGNNLCNLISKEPNETKLDFLIKEVRFNCLRRLDLKLSVELRNILHRARVRRPRI
jgi:hypothetical protein